MAKHIHEKCVYTCIVTDQRHRLYIQLDGIANTCNESTPHVWHVVLTLAPPCVVKGSGQPHQQKRTSHFLLKVTRFCFMGAGFQIFETQHWNDISFVVLTTWKMTDWRLQSKLKTIPKITSLFSFPGHQILTLCPTHQDRWVSVWDVQAFQQTVNPSVSRLDAQSKMTWLSPRRPGFLFCEKPK